MTPEPLPQTQRQPQAAAAREADAAPPTRRERASLTPDALRPGPLARHQLITPDMAVVMATADRFGTIGEKQRDGINNVFTRLQMPDVPRTSKLERLLLSLATSGMQVVLGRLADVIEVALAGAPGAASGQPAPPSFVAPRADQLGEDVGKLLTGQIEQLVAGAYAPPKRSRQSAIASFFETLRRAASDRASTARELYVMQVGPRIPSAEVALQIQAAVAAACQRAEQLQEVATLAGYCDLLAGLDLGTMQAPDGPRARLGDAIDPDKRRSRASDGVVSMTGWCDVSEDRNINARVGHMQVRGLTDTVLDMDSLAGQSFASFPAPRVLLLQLAAPGGRYGTARFAVGSGGQLEAQELDAPAREALLHAGGHGAYTRSEAKALERGFQQVWRVCGAASLANLTNVRP